MVSVQSVFKCDDFNDGNPALRGLNGDYQAGNGVFGTAKNGGGVFGPSLYGLNGQSDDIDAIANYILNTGTKSTAAFDLQSEFRGWYNNLGFYDKNFSDDAVAKATSYRERFNASNVAGGGGALAPAPAPSGSGAQPVTADATKAIQQTLNTALIAAGYKPIDADGKLGAGTCGAIAWYQQTVNPAAGAQFASACATKKPWTAPSKPSAYKAPLTTTATLPTTTTQPPASETTKAGMMGAGAWAMVAGGVLAIGVAVVGKKKGWF